MERQKRSSMPGSGSLPEKARQVEGGRQVYGALDRPWICAKWTRGVDRQVRLIAACYACSLDDNRADAMRLVSGHRQHSHSQ